MARVMRPYGSKPKLRSFGSKPPDPLSTIRTDIERLLAEHDKLVAEELRLFKIVDKYDMAGKGDSDEAYDKRKEWNALWRKIDRHNSAMHNTMARERMLRNGQV